MIRKKIRTLLLILILVFLYKNIAAGKAIHGIKANDSYQIYTVQKGDTLWGIAQKHTGSKDIRKTVYTIQKVNGITPLIRPGQKIKIPEGDILLSSK